MSLLLSTLRASAFAARSSAPVFGEFATRVVSASYSSTSSDASTTATPADSASQQQPDATAAAEAAAAKAAELAAQVEKLTQQLKEKDIKFSELTDHYKHALADAENLRQRTKREVENAHHYAVTKFAKDVLSIGDVLAMALSTVKSEQLADNKPLRDLHEGLTLTSNELHATLHRHGVMRIDATEGDKFDPKLHNALFQAPVPGREPGTLLQVTKSGYMIHGRVLRPAEVGVVQDLSS
ncbi:GrpE-domain-containing protein [Blastocladiella britannica]|nr:GrpE-domain-containing protein [Blastocladiella britannica]